MDALTLLREDHRKVKRLLTELETTTERGVKTRTELFARIKAEALGPRDDRGGDLLSGAEAASTGARDRA